MLIIVIRRERERETPRPISDEDVIAPLECLASPLIRAGERSSCFYKFSLFFLTPISYDSCRESIENSIL